MTKTLVGTQPVSSPWKCSNTHNILTEVSHEKQNSLGFTTTIQPWSLSSRYLNVV